MKTKTRFASACFAIGLAAAAGCATITEPSVDADFRRLFFGKDATFGILHVTDIQGNLHERSAKVLRGAIDQYGPSLIVLTGDNVGSANNKGQFEATIAPFIALVKEKKVSFCVTFGNHDSERKGTNFWTRQEQYDIYKREGGDCFVDHDVPGLTGVGNGVVGIYRRGAKTPAFNLFVMDSGEYAPGGYNGCVSDQIAWYEKVSGATPCLWFQHIIVPDANDTGLFVAAAEGEVGIAMPLNGKKTQVKLAPGVLGAFKEATCPTVPAVYADAAHTFEGRTLYQSWVKMGNMKGAWFGHDHMNTFDGTDGNGIRIGMTKSLTLSSYNDDNPGLRIFTLHENGSYETLIVAEK